VPSSRYASDDLGPDQDQPQLAWFLVHGAVDGVPDLLLAYPLGLGIWISFTDARIGRPGVFVGVENYEWLWGDSIFWLSVFNTLLYTFIASAIKFAVVSISRCC